MKKKHCGRKVEMKQIKKVSLIGALVLIISAVALLSSCQQPNSNQGNTGNNTDGGNFSPFTGSNDNSLWKRSSHGQESYLYAQKGIIYKVKFKSNNDVDETPKYGTVKNGKITIKPTDNDEARIRPVSIDGDELRIGSGEGAERYIRVEDPAKEKKVKDAL